MAKKLTDRVEAWRGRASIRYTMFLSFTASAIIAVFLTGITLYLRFSSQLNTAIQAENQMVMEQVEQSLSTYLRDMLGLADSCSYNVVKGRNVQNEDLTGELMLLYDTYSEYVDSIAVFDPQGNLVATAPASIEVEGQDLKITTKVPSAIVPGSLADPLFLIVNTHVDDSTFAMSL